MSPAAAMTVGGRALRPKPGPEPFPSSGYPPTNTTNVTNEQTDQFRPDNQDSYTYNLGLKSEAGHAFWDSSPSGGGPVYPLVTNQSSGLPNGHDTVVRGGEILGTWNPLTTRYDFYNTWDSGVEQSNDTTTGYAIVDGHYSQRMPDVWRFVGNGNAYMKRVWAADILDGFVEIDLWGEGATTGNLTIYDCLVEGCYTGISNKSPGNTTSTVTLDGVLMWVKPTTDTPESVLGGDAWCTGAGCTELNGVWSDGRYRGTNCIWEGDNNSPLNVVVRNSWFRLDRLSTWASGPMGWPGQTNTNWNPGNASQVLTIGPDVKVLWTGAGRTLDGGGNIQAGAAAYPGPTLPAGVELVSGQPALDMWNRAAADWKAAHGY